MDFGSMTPAETKRLAIEALSELNDEDYIDVILQTTQQPDYMRAELIFQLEDAE